VSPGALSRAAGITSLALLVALVAALFPAKPVSQQPVVPESLLPDSLPGDPNLFLDGFDKRGLSSLDDIGRRAAVYAERWRMRLERQGLSRREAEAVGLMLFTSTLWSFGNAGEPNRPGCTGENENNGWKRELPTVDVVKEAHIGCCTDYAAALAIALSKNGFENRYGLLGGAHVFVEARIDGRWEVLDANTNMFVDASWNDAIGGKAGVHVHLFPHPGAMEGRLHSDLEGGLRDSLVDLVSRGMAPRAEMRPGLAPDPAYTHPVTKLYRLGNIL